MTGKRNNRSVATVRFKHNAARRHRIGKVKFKIANRVEYEAGLRRRGSLTLWMTAKALSSWRAPQGTTCGGQPRYSDLATETALTLGSVLNLMGLDIAVPDHTTKSRRARTWRSVDWREGRSAHRRGAVHVLTDSAMLEIYGAGRRLGKVWLKMSGLAAATRSSAPGFFRKSRVRISVVFTGEAARIVQISFPECSAPPRPAFPGGAPACHRVKD